MLLNRQSIRRTDMHIMGIALGTTYVIMACVECQQKIREGGFSFGLVRPVLEICVGALYIAYNLYGLSNPDL